MSKEETEFEEKANVLSISESKEIAAPIDRVWDILADVDADPRYYPGLKSIRNISKEGNVIEREAIVGLLNQKIHQTIVIKPKESVEAEMAGGPMRGTRSVTLTPSGEDKTRVNISWKLEIKGIPPFFRGRARSQFVEGTKEALERIARAAQ